MKIYSYFKNYLRQKFPKYYPYLDRHKKPIKYVFSGGTATLVDFFLLYLLHGVLKINVVVSATMAFAAAFFVSFTLQKFWTFRDNGLKKIYKQMFMYLGVGLFGLSVNAIGIYILVEKFDVWYILGQAITGGSLAMFNFLIYSLFIFRKKRRIKFDGQQKNIKVLVATGIFPPDIGGPATFAKALQEELINRGNYVKVISYGEGGDERVARISRHQNILLRYFKYFLHTWNLSKKVDVIYAFDLICSGLPCAVVKILRPEIRLVVRIGGDYQWERATEKGLYCGSVEKYFADNNFKGIEKRLNKILNFVLSKSDYAIFNAYLLRDVYVKYRKALEEKITVIKNISPVMENKERKKENKDYISILFLGRLVAFKNLINLIKVFAEIDFKKYPKKVVLEIVGDGPEKQKLEKIIKDNNWGDKILLLPKMERDQALDKIFNCNIFVTPSWTEINANTVSEAQHFNKPIILTRESESYFVGEKNEKLFYVDPFDDNDIKQKIELVLDKYFRGEFKEDVVVPKQDISEGAGNITQKLLDLFEKLLTK